MAIPDVLIFDTTLRDGEQAPGNSLSPEEKLRLARQLDALRVDIMEAGFPAASEGDYRSVQQIAGEIRRPVVAALARCHERDIELAGEAIGPAARGRLHVFISTSDLHIKEKLRTTREDVLARARAAIRQARQYTDDVEFSAEDASRTDPEFLCRIVEVAIQEGATTVNLPDTVGYAMPEEYGRMFRDILEKVPGADRVVLSAHCHDDLGLAVANSLAAIAAGRAPGGMHHERHRRAGRQRGDGGAGDGEPRARLGARLPVQRGDPRDLPHQPAAFLPHRQLPAAQQGDRGTERIRPRGRHPSARHAAERAHLRDHPAGDGRDPALDAGARQTLGPARARTTLPRAGLRPERGAARGGLSAVHRPGRSEARDPRRGPAGAGTRELPRCARGIPAHSPAGRLRQHHPHRRGTDDRPVGGRAVGAGHR